MADTVCDRDPRTRKQRRADAMGALAAGAERLACRCRRPDCPAVAAAPPSAVVVHMIAEQASLDCRAPTPGSMIGADGLIPPEMVTELARTAKLRPLIHPADVAPEAGYAPSRGLADFVRCRDLTCRFPVVIVPRCAVISTIRSPTPTVDPHTRRTSNAFAAFIIC
ncbi:hypothetical protein I553_1859 [Mycobacterium xenopi 4042]|uniref:DUF222 domain-containing protein n=1 Tax=Mycobacterium xenopi 4042 TaxID=1299334 RepID=X8DKV0_MYCXE|nr:hypothetical protein I553_1859 [Mycobacterium xenopi 4042]